MINKFKTCLSGLIALAAFTGCISYYDYTTMPGDNAVDESNMNFVAQDMKIAEARKKFRRQVKIKMSEKAERFLSPRYYRRTGKLFISPDLRKDLLATVDSKLVNIIQGMRDFELIGSEESLRTAPGATITRVPAQGTPSAATPYLITFNINNVEVRDANDTIRGVTNVVGAGLTMSGASYRTHRAVNSANRIHWYFASVDLEITLTDPRGKVVFNFAQSVHCPDTFPSNGPSETALRKAVTYAVKKAMEQYAAQFAPPLYVDRTIGNGLFVRLSAGSAYGIVKGQRVRFFRKVQCKVPTLPGEPQKFEIQKQYLSSGVVGAYQAPVERDHAWVYVSGNDEVRAVSTWASAEIVK